MLRSLVWYWRTHAALALGCAVATAVLTGALIVGDSVRSSLREMSERRLGGVELALVGSRFVGEDLAASLVRDLDPDGGAGVRVAPLIIVPGATRHAESGRRHQKTTLYGIDERFLETFDAEVHFDRQPGQLFPSAVANSALAHELGAAVGDQVLVTFGEVSAVPRESLIGRRDASSTVETLRLTLVAVLDESDRLDPFSLELSQASSPALFVPLSHLQRALEQDDRANAIVARGVDATLANDALRSTLTAVDIGLSLRQVHDQLLLESEQLVLPPKVVEAALSTAIQAGVEPLPILTYLANQIDHGDLTVPYSTVTALDTGLSSARSGLTLTDGSNPPVLQGDDILLDAWTADILEVQSGDPVALSYYEVGPHEELTSRRHNFTVRGIVAMQGLAVDSSLTPPYPGMTEAEDISSWNPPFPIDLDRIEDRDEEYWDRYGAAPKAFVSLATGRRLWGTRYGDVTSLRLSNPLQAEARVDPGTAEETDSPVLDAPRLDGDSYLAEVMAAINPADLGLAFLPVRRQALDAATGATDFSQLFLGFSFFLIASAALLASLLFRLGLEEREGEIGLLLALGFPPKSVQGRFRREGLLVGGLGALFGTLGAVLYAGTMLHGLNTRWRAAVGTSQLELHLMPLSLILGALGSWLLVAWTLSRAVRRLGSRPATALLASRPSSDDLGSGSARLRLLAGGSIALGVLLLLIAAWRGGESMASLTLVAGALLLVGGLSGYAAWLGRRRSTAPPADEGRPLLGPPILSLGLRNAQRHRLRSITSVALVASACFVVALVTAFRGDPEIDAKELASRAGGFSLMAEAAVPLTADLNRAADRTALDLGSPDDLFEGTRVVPFRLRPGDDASCLNLYRPTTPRILGAPASFVKEAGFLFHSAADDRKNPWSLLDEPLEAGVIPAIADFASAQWILHKGLGDDIVLPLEGGEPVRLRLVALLEGSVFQSELLVAEHNFTTLFPDRSGYGFYLLDVAEPARRDPIATRLESGLERYGFDVQSTADRLSAFDAVQRTYLATFQSLGGLGFLLGTLGLGIVMLRNVLERRRELAALQAFGFRTRTLAAAVVVENGSLLLTGMLLGALAGLSAAAPRLIGNLDRVPFLDLGLTLGALLIAGLLSTLVAVRVVLKMPILPNL
ncbi:MAG: FtsX-like permease family protein [Thermoanaerobaculia bacterium]|nr:FtsX-like permease family protein [Thermoanaerobaculia bacterium]